MLGGEPGNERTLTIERAEKQFTVVAKVQHFLGEDAENPNQENSKKRN